MTSRVEATDSELAIRRHPIQYPISAYTFPQEAFISKVDIDETYIRIELKDGRLVAIPLTWIPTVYHAAPEERSKFRLNPRRTMIIWDPDECSINEELSVQDYLAPQVEAV